MLAALDELAHADRFDGWVAAWTTAMEHNDRFASALARATGQPPPAGE
jgi:hypothetical protein